jgi:hypothetical protein
MSIRQSTNKNLSKMVFPKDNISILKDRISVQLPSGKYAQFMAWDGIEDEDDIKNQIVLAFTICSDFESIERHLKINGLNIEMENIMD